MHSLGCWWDLRAGEDFYEMNKGWGPKGDSSFRLGVQHFVWSTSFILCASEENQPIWAHIVTGCDPSSEEADDGFSRVNGWLDYLEWVVSGLSERLCLQIKSWAWSRKMPCQQEHQASTSMHTPTQPCDIYMDTHIWYIYIHTHMWYLHANRHVRRIHSQK